MRLSLASPRELRIELADGTSICVHPLWLRERCPDAMTFDARSAQRLKNPSDFDPQLAILQLAEPQPGKLRVRFSDGHESELAVAELLAEAALPPGDHDLPAPRLWDRTLQSLPRALWNEAAQTEERARWLGAFLEWGFILFSGVPREPGQVLRVGAAFGFVRETNFGAIFDVRSTPDANDLAYTALPLDPHTDNPYRTPVPGVQLLHCLVNETTGGLSTLVDGCAAAEALRTRDAEAFETLTHTPVRFRFRDLDAELVASVPIIELDVTGRVQALHVSPKLEFVPLRPPAELARFYRARRTFDRLLSGGEFELRFLLDAGELMMMDNRRLLHGRTGFDPTEGLRHLQGCYIDIDGPRSLYRVLRRRLGNGRTQAVA
jgi:gamma-butyrobetaine dioxygenase